MGIPARVGPIGPFHREISSEMTCAEAKLKLEPCVSGTLSPEERIELEEHLAICEGCRLELELTRAVMGAPSFESADETRAAAAPEAPSFGPETPPSASETPSFAAETPPSAPEHPESRPQTPVYDEVSFADIASESSSAGPTAGPPVAAGKDAGSSEPDPFANFTKKPEEPAESTAATWDFEPAEVPRDSSPPEGSLSFANEALKRKHEVEERRKATFVRIALWGGGIGCGVLLLGISVWIALAFRQDKAPDLNPGGENPSATPQTETATPAPSESTATPNASEGGAAAPPPATAEQTTPTPAPSNATVQQAPTILDATPGVVASPGPPPPGKSGSKAKPKPGAKGAGKTASNDDEGPFPWRPVDDPPVARTSAARTGGGSAPGAATTSPTPDLGAPRTGETAPPPRPAPVNPPDAAAPDQGMPPFSSAPNAGGAASSSPSPEPSGEPAEQSPAPAITKPIDRLHLATETAAKNADLPALRKIKSSWKSLVGSTAGPDRTRAKLEYADCLWAIQEISGRNSDRREALTAYRDYVLYAPAGGTNARTVSRMRYLEDILTDK